jgi:putative Holliday junction resolvase
MPVMTLEELAAQLPPEAVLAGLDLGTKTIGIALSDRSLRFAHPRPVLRRTRFGRDAEVLSQLFEREKVAALVIGLPVNMDGTEGPRAQASRAFARNFDRIRPMPIVLWDERLSTVAAERALIGMDVSRSKRAERIDSAAAAFILQGVLDWLRRVRASPSAS